jgi:ribosomal protein S27E
MSNEVRKIKFYEDELLGVKDENGIIWMGVNQACKSLGLSEKQERTERERLHTDEVLKKGVTIIGIPSKGGIQKTLCVSEKFINLWLAKIPMNEKKKLQQPELYNKLIRYQLECAEILHNYFMGTEEKKEKFFNEMLGIDIKKIIQQNEILQSEVQSIKADFFIFRQESEQQREQLYFLVKRFSMYDNEDCNYTRLVDDFNAKMYNSCDIRNKHYLFWKGVSDFLGLDFSKLLNERNKKKYLKDKIGMRILNYFVDNVILDRIVLNKNGYFVNLQDFNSDPFSIEKNKIINYWTDINGNLRCCYCGKIINNPKENNTYNFEHMLPKTKEGTSNLLWNISISCPDCNEKKIVWIIRLLEKI